ncbi:hypothetical protein VB796_04725 [Arcicella sp. LKC2W]|nr:hypothetical protein [Arcicella sp. LKC2W]MEA5458327.1 hypothetical protein [Arcicella sp. LKC2W]
MIYRQVGAEEAQDMILANTWFYILVVLFVTTKITDNIHIN